MQVLNIKGLHDQVAKMSDQENVSLWEKLDSF